MDTDLLHDAGFTLRERNVATRLVGDELDLNLSALAAGLVIVIVVVVGGSRALTLDAATLDGIAIPNGMVVERRRRALVVLVGDVGHVD